MVFIVYPEAIATMNGSVFWSIIFFLMLITLGLDSTFGGLEAMITALCDEYPRFLGRRREIFVAVLLLAIYICALPTTTYVSIETVTIFGDASQTLQKQVFNHIKITSFNVLLVFDNLPTLFLR